MAQLSSGSGHKFERTKVRIAEKVELLSARTFVLHFFSVHIEGEELQQWQATYFKACSESGRMTLKLNFYCLPKRQKVSGEDKLWMYHVLFKM